MSLVNVLRRRARSSAGQSTVEAAVLLPSLMLVFALMLQPVCLSYTRAVMRSAAAECARAAATSYGGGTQDCKRFALRRLRAVPNASLFHVGGESDWQISIDSSGGAVSVRIQGHARPLPIMGALAALASKRDGTGVVLEASVSEMLRPEWLGGDYGSWQSLWG